MGADFIDYLIADRTLIPEQSQKFYSEKIVYMPHCYQVSDNSRQTSDTRITRAELGLPEAGFVFCCFNHNYKITPGEFDIWMQLLTAVEGSVLWLRRSNEWAEVNLKKEAEARGVDPGRLIFAKKCDYSHQYFHPRRLHNPTTPSGRSACWSLAVNLLPKVTRA